MRSGSDRGAALVDRLQNRIDTERAKETLLTAYARNILYQDIIPRYGLRNSELIAGLFFIY